MKRETKQIDISIVEQYYRIEEDGMVWSYRKNKYLKPTFNTAGYLYVCITCLSNRPWYAVHRLVSAKYIGQCPKGKETSHKDGVRTNNHYTNLEYLSHSANILKSYREHGRKAPEYRHLPFSVETKLLMANAKKKRVKLLYKRKSTIYGSIADAAKAINIDRKQVYTCIYTNRPINSKKSTYNGGILSFVDTKI
jgi:hypothetical protein